MDPRYALGPAAWLSRDDYPFESRTVSLPDGAMHYIDEGEGHPIVFVHGCPTWSFHFRKVIEDLRKDFRCIAPDHIGFGLSAKRVRADLSPGAHARRLGELLERLEVSGATVVAQDIGAPIALSFAASSEKHVRDYVLFNSWLWPMHEELWVRRLYAVACNPLNLMWQRTLNTSPQFFLPVMFADLHSLPRAIRNQYLEPFRSVPERRAAFSLVRSIMEESAWFAQVWSQRLRYASKRSLILWGMDDPNLGEDSLERIAEALPRAQVVPLVGVGNYVCEHAPRRCAAEIREFLSNASSTGVEAAATG